MHQMKSQRISKTSKEEEEIIPQSRPKSVSVIIPNLSNYLNEQFPNIQAFITKFSQQSQNYANFATDDRQRQEEQQIPMSDEQIMVAGQCQICLSQIIKQQDVLSLSLKCKHTFCQTCLNSYLQSRFAGLLPIVCPHDGCAQAYSKDSQYFQKLKPRYQKQCKRVQLAVQISKDPTKKLCPSQICDLGVITIQKDEKTTTCDKCNTEFCVKCLMKKHKEDCDKTQINYLQDYLKFKKCKKCKMVVERSQGCTHMTCRCGYEFCYSCGRTFTSYHKCDNCLIAFKDFPEPIKIMLQVIFMFLFFLASALIITVIMVVSLVLGTIGGSIAGPVALIYKLCSMKRIGLVALAIIFYPIIIVIAVLIACIYLFLTISKKFFVYWALNFFYAIKQL